MRFLILLRTRFRLLFRPSKATAPPAVPDPHPLGDAERLSLRLLRHVMAYDQAVFGRARPVDGHDRAAVRARAYNLAAHDDLPEVVRVAAADALAALDHADRTASDQAVAVLSTAVREQVAAGRDTAP
jgi:hypothetical protein